MTLEVTSEQKGQGVVIVNVTGSLDSNTYRVFEGKVDALINNSTKMLVLNLEQLEYLSSAGVRVFLKARKNITKSGGQVQFINPRPQIQRVFEIMNAIPSSNIFKNMEELDRYLDAQMKKVIADQN